MLKRIFPEMTDRPDKGMFMAVILYGFIAFILLPVVAVILGVGMWDDVSSTAWIEFFYHLLNALVAVGMFKTYLGESFWNVQIYTARFWKTVALTTLIMLTIALDLHFVLAIPVNDAYPLYELPICMTSGVMVMAQPILGIVCHVVFMPFIIAGLFYATGFAPFCCKKPWLGYLIVPIAVAIPLALDVNWRGEGGYMLQLYLMQLPIHLLACWSYHKADTIWAPITCLAIFNMLTSLLSILPI